MTKNFGRLVLECLASSPLTLCVRRSLHFLSSGAGHMRREDSSHALPPLVGVADPYGGLFQPVTVVEGAHPPPEGQLNSKLRHSREGTMLTLLI